MGHTVRCGAFRGRHEDERLRRPVRHGADQAQVGELKGRPEHRANASRSARHRMRVRRGHAPHRVHVDRQGRDEAMPVRPLVQVCRAPVARPLRLRLAFGEGCAPLKNY